jgi:hypothetical protein
MRGHADVGLAFGVGSEMVVESMRCPVARDGEVHMAHFSVKIFRLIGAVLDENQP